MGKKVYIVLRLLVNENGSSCDNTSVVLGVFKTYEDAMKCVNSYTNKHVGFTRDFRGDDTSSGGREIFALGYEGAYSEKISIFESIVLKKFQ